MTPRVPPSTIQKGPRNSLTPTTGKGEEVYLDAGYVGTADGFIERSMGGLVFRGTGIIRAKACVALTNLTYNIARLAQIYRCHHDGITVP